MNHHNDRTKFYSCQQREKSYFTRFFVPYLQQVDPDGNAFTPFHASGILLTLWDAKLTSVKA